jgi:GntR family transcriptional regulator, rspAB operon transcriptional repressor
MADFIELQRERIYHRLRQDILSCALAPGTSLYEGALADRFEVSKSPIRDALSRLTAEKLVTVVPRKGYRVAPISLSDAAELFEFRSLLEMTCAQMGAERASAAELEALDRFRTLESWGGAAGFVRYNREFHLAVIQLCPNRRIAEAARDLIEQFDRLVLMSVNSDARNVEGLLAEHAVIIDALQERDGRRAGKLVAQHVGKAERRVMGALANAAIVP